MRIKWFVPLPFLFLACIVPSYAQSEVTPAAPVGENTAAGDDDLPLMSLLYDVGREFMLNCTESAAPGVSLVYTWKKNNTAIEAVWEMKDRYKLEENNAVFRTVGRTKEDDAGNYTCRATAGGALAGATGWRVSGRPHAKLSANTNVVEGQKLKLICKLIGKPYPNVEWRYSNVTGNETASVNVSEALGERVTLQESEQGVAGGVLVVEPAWRSDAGRYTCVPAGGVNDTTVLRVKDMYAALWPFLGICAEVFVLCAIILVYEKRRTKPELDDSDTDNHRDQKKS